MLGNLNPLGWLRTIAIAAGVAGAVGLIAYMKGTSDGREYERAAAMRAAFEQLQERGLINEEVRSLDDCDLLRELGADSLPDGCPD